MGINGNSLNTDLALIRCSNACTRAGLSALLDVAVTVGMIQPLIREKALDAYVQYANLRLELRDRVETLIHSTCWQGFLKQEGEQRAYGIQLKLVDELQCAKRQTRPSLSRLLKGISGASETTGDFIVTPTQPKIPPKTPPSAPTGFEIHRIEWTLGEEINSALVDLMGAHIMAGGGQHSSRAERSVNRWKRLIRQRFEDNGWKPKKSEQGRLNGKTEAYVWEIRENAPLDYLKVRDVLELAEAELPDLSEADLLQAQSRVTFQQIPIPLDLGTGTILVEFALFLAMGYFLLYQKEAEHSKVSTTDATIFAVFQRSKTRQISFFLLCFLPPVASFLLVKFSLSEKERYVNGIVFVLVLTLSLMVAKTARTTFQKFSLPPFKSKKVKG